MNRLVFALYYVSLYVSLPLFPTVARGQDGTPKQIVQQAVQTELTADRADHSCWLYYEVNRKPRESLTQWVAQTAHGELNRVIMRNGHPVSISEQKQKMDSFLHNSSQQAQQRKTGQHDDDEATQLLKLLPDGFLWSVTSTQGAETILHFKPNPQFRPPSRESRVFAATDGEMKVNNAQHRIVSLKGRLIHEVKFGGGLLGRLDAGGTFDVERREVGKDLWQITETHVHMQGRALLFKSISEQEDDEKSKFTPLPEKLPLAQAEAKVLAAGQ
jgi:hypothetical protein